MQKPRHELIVKLTRPFPDRLVSRRAKSQSLTEADFENLTSLLFNHYEIDHETLEIFAWKFLAFRLMCDVFPAFRSRKSGPGAPKKMDAPEARQARQQLMKIVEEHLARTSGQSVTSICEKLATGTMRKQIPSYYKGSQYGDGPSARVLRDHVRIARNERAAQQQAQLIFDTNKELYPS